ncbi:hypothetical protein JI721_12005 [Alicyclobacillus cycloheptanicus]|uniref:Uncharacterized protein n=1 Tax=Alicyclobacillus cycloheptanicus TaxID=1457 RepID=A0ABT9XGN7_9BACL|nr:hypothetical protein [Alicyclobacillus cycloheptanicus]MDQ0189260.1 hypothetical protein [Alicyclobacillus cycloheptanicus]WDM00443.1 hypothetical protein JI721_12005 [Alicyclobacillus cycloheptanicus]
MALTAAVLDAKYGSHQHQFPSYANPEQHLKRIREDAELRNKVIDKLIQMVRFRGQYTRMLFGPHRSKITGNIVVEYHSKKIPRDKHYRGTIAVTRKLLEGHLTQEGEDTYAVAAQFRAPDETSAIGVRWGLFDVDIPDADVARRATIAIWRACSSLGIESHISYSGGKGFHVEIFVNNDGVSSPEFEAFHHYVMDCCGIRKLIQPVIDRVKAENKRARPDVECRPRKSAGQPAKLPLTLHQRTRFFAGYLQVVGNELVEVRDPYDYFLGIEFNADPQIIHECAEKYMEFAARKALAEQEEKAPEQLERAAKHRGKREERARLRAEYEETKAIKVQDGDEVGTRRKEARIEQLLTRFGALDEEINVDATGIDPAVQEEIEEILRKGLVDAGRNETTFRLLTLLRSTHTKEQALKKVTNWSRDVLYPRCGTQIETPLDEHLLEVEDMVERVWRYPALVAQMVELSVGEIHGVARFAMGRAGINTKRFHLLVTLYILTRFAEQSLLTNDGYILAAYHYLHKITKMSFTTIQKNLEALNNTGAISIIEGKRYGVSTKQNGAMFLDPSKAQIQQIRVNVHNEVAGESIRISKWMLGRRGIGEWLLVQAYEPDELFKVCGGRQNRRKYQRVLEKAKCVFGTGRA